MTTKLLNIIKGRRTLVLFSLAVIIAMVVTAFPLHIQTDDYGRFYITIGSRVSAAEADYTCDGDADDATFQAALNALPSAGGQLFILAGNYTWAPATTVTRAIDNVSIIGIGAAVSFAGDDSTAIFTAGGDNWLFSNFKTDAGGLDMGATTDWMWLNVNIDTTYYALRTDSINIEDHSSLHGVGGVDTIFPADPGADKYLMWDDVPGQLSWEDGGGIGDMAKATYDTDEDGDIDTAAGGTEWDSSAATGVAYITAGAWGTRSTGITHTYIVVIDGTPNEGEYARFTASGIEGRTEGEFKQDYNLEIGTDVQAYDAELAAIAGLTSAADKVIYFTGSGTAATSNLTAFARSILDDANEATFKATVNLEIGTDIQAWDTDLDDIAALSDGDSNFIVGNGANWVVESGATVRESLGLIIGTNVQAYDAELAALAGLTSAEDKVPYFTGSETAGVTNLTAYGRSMIAVVDEAAFKLLVNLEIGVDVQAWDDDLDDIAALTATNGTFIVGNGIDWINRILADADIPDAICRDDEVPDGVAITELDTKASPIPDDIMVIVDTETEPDETKKITLGTFVFADEMTTPIADYPLLLTTISASTPFSANINGNPTATSVVYDTDSNEGCLDGISASMWGRIILHNTTRGKSRKITNVNVSTNTITTESSTDDWANNDDITMQSQTNTEAGYCDLDLSGEIPEGTKAVIFYSQVNNLNAATGQSIIWHPYTAYNGGYRTAISCTLATDVQQIEHILQVISQTVTFNIVCTDGSFRAYCKGYIPG